MARYENWQKHKIEESRIHQEAAFVKLNGMVVDKRQGKLITLEDGRELVEFVSCSYLGLDQNPRILDAVSKHLNETGINFAVARTRFRLKDSVILESLLSTLFCDANVILFTSLHLAHLGFIPLIASGEMPGFPLKKGIHFILDKHAHASIQINRGLMQQFGQVSVISFHDLTRVTQLFKETSEMGYTPVCFSDGIGSMGDMAPVTALVKLAESYDGYVYIDDAHGTSVFGRHGEGYALEQLGSSFHPRLILTASLSKAFGTHGAVLALPTQVDEDMVRHYCSPYLFSNPIASPLVEASIASAKIHLSDELSLLQQKLRKNLILFDDMMCDTFSVINQHTFSPIRCIQTGEESKTIDIALALRRKGFAATSAMYPTVAKGKSLIRVAICANHMNKHIESFCQSFKEISHKMS